MMKQAKRVIALLLSIVILVGLVPGHVFAEGETVLVPVGQAVYDANGLFVLNELGAFIWNLLPEVNTADEICKAVLEEYDVPQETAAADIAEFLDKLKTMQIL